VFLRFGASVATETIFDTSLVSVTVLALLVVPRPVNNVSFFLSFDDAVFDFFNNGFGIVDLLLGLVRDDLFYNFRNESASYNFFLWLLDILDLFKAIFALKFFKDIGVNSQDSFVKIFFNVDLDGFLALSFFKENTEIFFAVKTDSVTIGVSVLDKVSFRDLVLEFGLDKLLETIKVRDISSNTVNFIFINDFEYHV